MTEQHRKDRAAQKAFQEKRWNEEQNIRASRIRKGFKGMWDKLTFKYWTIRKENEKDVWTCHVRDREERQELIEVQLDRRQNLQVKFSGMRQRHEQEMQKLAADLVRVAMPEAERNATPAALRGQAKLVDLGAEKLSSPLAPSRRRGRSTTPEADPEV